MPSPTSEDVIPWQGAIEAYHADQVIAAFRLVECRGVGEGGEFMRWFRLIEAEALTRRLSVVYQARDWLQIESIPGETMVEPSVLGDTVAAICDQVAQKFGWRHPLAVQFTLLARQVEQPWTVSPHGYWMSKSRYDKICLPYCLLEDPDEFALAVGHEYAHVITSGISGDEAPPWLEEGISVAVEGGIDEATRDQFLASPELWISEAKIDASLDEDAGDPSGIYMAYQQCGWIVDYLIEQQGYAGLVKFLESLGTTSPWRRLQSLMMNRSRTDSALYQVYGFGSRVLFDRAYARMRDYDYVPSRIIV